MKTITASATVLFVLVGACTVNSTNSGGGGNGGNGSTCNPDTGVSCPTNATGYTCGGTDSPAQADSNLDCGDGVIDNGGNTDYCCIPFSSGSTCAPDSSVGGCASGSYGFSCTGSDTPDQADSTLVCSDGTPGNGETLYCCATSGSPPSGNTCNQDSSVSCSG